MQGTLSERQQEILNVIVGSYVASAMPVPSQTIASNAGLSVSPATIRHEMAELEEEGYILRRHISGGGIPSDKGYRLHVETLPDDPSLPADERRGVLIALESATFDVEQWARRASELLADLVGNVAVVTEPKAPRAKIKRVELVHLQDFLAMLVLVLQEARIKQRILHLDEAATQGDLTALANRFSTAYGGATPAAIAGSDTGKSRLEQQILDATRELLLAEEEDRVGEPVATGLGYFLAQPEFAEASRARPTVDALEDRQFLQDVLRSRLAGAPVGVAIGEENEAEALRDCSVVICRYGAAGEVGGYVAVVGPTRMKYGRSMASARAVSQMMSRLVEDIA